METDVKKPKAWKQKLVFFAVCLFGLDFLLFFSAYFFMPADDAIDLQDFHGRKYSAEKVKPGTFAIERPFDEALSWGKDALLSYDSNSIEVWRPDPQTNGVFEHAKKDLRSTFFVAHPYVGDWFGDVVVITYGVNWGNLLNSLPFCGIAFLIYALSTYPSYSQQTSF